MVTIIFSGNGQFLAQMTLPTVPRIGERVVLDDPSGLWNVAQVTWEVHGSEVVAQVEMAKMLEWAKTEESSLNPHRPPHN
jgi:hypothetical protein